MNDILINTDLDENQITVAGFVSSGIEQIFSELAARVGSEPSLTEGMSDDEVAGIPSLLFHAEKYLQKEWRKYIHARNA